MQEHILSLKRLRQLLNSVSAICLFLQILFGFSYNNIISNLLCYLIFYLTVITVFNVRNMRFSSAFLGILVFLIISANSIAPVLGTLFDGNPLTYSLISPVETFMHRFVFGLVLLVAFYFAKQRSYLSLSTSFSNFAYSLKISEEFNVKAIWGFGLIGLSSFVIKFVPLPEFLSKFIDGFGFLMWAPFILVVYKSKQSDINTKSISRYLLVAYFVLMVLISLITNSRMAMLGPIGVVLGTWLVLLLTGNKFVNIVLLRKGMLLGLVGLYVLSILLDISTAILMSRANRATSSVDELIATTYQNFQDKEAIDRFRMNTVRLEASLPPTDTWQEDYLRNPFLGRFVQIKFDDNLFHRVSEYSDETKQKLAQISYDKILVVFPSPILNLFNINLDKKYLNSFSMGDIMEVFSGRSALGGFKTGSIPANAYAIYGWYYPIILFIFYYLIFSLNAGLVSLPERFKQPYHISTLGLLLPFSLFLSASLDGITQLGSLILRGIPQTVFIFYLAIGILKKTNFIK